LGGDEPGRVHGPLHARETVDWLRTQFPDLEMTIEAIVADDDTVAVRVRSEGTNLGRLGGVAPATKQALRRRASSSLCHAKGADSSQPRAFTT